MKKLFVFLLCFGCLIAQAQVVIDTSRISREDLIGFLLKYQTVDPVPAPVPDPAPDPGQEGIASYVDAYYTADKAVYDASGTVTALKAVKGQDIPYAGLKSPTIQRPYFLNGEVVFVNQPTANFKLLTRANNNPFPYPDELTIVFRKMPGTDWEAILSGWGNPYVGFGSDNIRVGNSNGYLNKAAFPDYFKLSFIHVRYEANQITVWLNGRNVGTVKTSDISRRLGFGVGIETNSTNFNWRASMFISGGLTDTDRESYFKAIEATYAIGSLPSLPYASDVRYESKNGTLTASYKYNGSAPEDKSKVRYEWWQMVDGLTTQKLIGTGPTIPAQRGVKVRVKVCDQQGRSWMFISGKYQ